MRESLSLIMKKIVIPTHYPTLHHNMHIVINIYSVTVYFALSILLWGFRIFIAHVLLHKRRSFFYKDNTLQNHFNWFDSVLWARLSSKGHHFMCNIFQSYLCRLIVNSTFITYLFFFYVTLQRMYCIIHIFVNWIFLNTVNYAVKRIKKLSIIIALIVYKRMQ